jgi:hypothetical protein
MKFLFQRFALREVHTSTSKPAEQYLWPFCQPRLNNRFIDVPSFLWNPADVSSEKMIPSIFKKTETGFDSQAVYSTPFAVHKSSSEEANNLDKACLGAMVEGTQSTDDFNDLVFSNLIADKCGVADMEKCYMAMVVSYSHLFVQISISISKEYPKMFLICLM